MCSVGCLQGGRLWGGQSGKSSSKASWGSFVLNSLGSAVEFQLSSICPLVCCANFCPAPHAVFSSCRSKFICAMVKQILKWHLAESILTSYGPVVLIWHAVLMNLICWLGKICCRMNGNASEWFGYLSHLASVTALNIIQRAAGARCALIKQNSILLNDSFFLF